MRLQLVEVEKVAIDVVEILVVDVVVVMETGKSLICSLLLPLPSIPTLLIFSNIPNFWCLVLLGLFSVFFFFFMSLVFGVLLMAYFFLPLMNQKERYFTA